MVTIRAADPGDSAALNRLYGELDLVHADGIPTVCRHAPPPARPQEYLDRLLADPTVGLFVAEQGGILLGLVSLRIRSPPDYAVLVPRTYCFMEDLVVAATSRRSGVGMALVEYAEAWAAGRGASTMELGVWEFNAHAITFYTKLGYRTFSRRMWKCLNARRAPDSVHPAPGVQQALGDFHSLVVTFVNDNQSSDCAGGRLGNVLWFDYLQPEGNKLRFWVLPGEDIMLAHRPWPLHYVEWVVHLVESERLSESPERWTVVDREIDILVEPDLQTYRIIDLEDLGQAIEAGRISPQTSHRILSATQAFVDSYLHGGGRFPPSAVSELVSQKV
jgi:GNAT superfamily N-acetyltransferase